MTGQSSTSLQALQGEIDGAVGPMQDNIEKIGRQGERLSFMQKDMQGVLDRRLECKIFWMENANVTSWASTP